MQVQMGKDWNVGEHHSPHEVEVREAKVQGIRHLEAPLLRLSDMRLGPVETQKFAGDTDWIKNDERCVSRIENYSI